MEELSRRDLLVVVGGLSCSLISGCGEPRKKRSLLTTGTLNIGPAQNYPAGKVNPRFLESHGLVISNDGGIITAIRPTCTHLGCETDWQEDSNQFVCPCHASRFNIQGVVVTGPAKKPLLRVATQSLPDGTLTVDLGRLAG